MSQFPGPTLEGGSRGELGGRTRLEVRGEEMGLGASLKGGEILGPKKRPQGGGDPYDLPEI